MIVISLSFFVLASTASPRRPRPASTRASKTRTRGLLLLLSLVEALERRDEGVWVRPQQAGKC